MQESLSPDYGQDDLRFRNLLAQDIFTELVSGDTLSPFTENAIDIITLAVKMDNNAWTAASYLGIDFSDPTHLAYLEAAEHYLQWAEEKDNF